MGVNSKMLAFATGAGIQLGTDVTEEVAPGTAQKTTNIEGNGIEDPNAINTDGEVLGDMPEDVAVEDNAVDETAGQNTGSTNEAQTEDEINADSAIAYIEVKNYTIEGGLLEAGNDLSINLTIQNISSAARAESLVMTMSSQSGMVFPKYGTDNQIVIGTLLPKESKTISIPVTVSSKLEADSADFTCKFDYLSLEKQMSSTSTMILTTSSGKSLAVKSIDINAHAILNGKSLLNISYVNMTNGNITDAELLIEGNVSDDSKKIRLDTVYAGKTYTKDYNVTFTNAGEQAVKVKLVYTDITGERMQADLGTFSVTVSPEVSSNKPSGTNAILLWGGRALAAVVLLAIVGICFTYFKKK
ncbi:hypothetical protein [Butyrivibrio sp. WCD2001]|uniref:hypothetical protein n=1 Tax=Butyrivibrio sp. WCD2001 TaxID=1280681 RepID=UPI0018CB2878|nr:hypothetical protein [Butyrivibrio sp. WCD2001]